MDVGSQHVMNHLVSSLLVVLIMLPSRGIMAFTQPSFFLRLGRRCPGGSSSGYIHIARGKLFPPSDTRTHILRSSSRMYVQGPQSLKDIEENLLNKYGMTSSLALSFFKFAPIENPDTLAAQVKDMLGAKEVLGTVYVAREGINAAMCIPTKSLSSLKIAFEEIDNDYFRDIQMNIGECMPHDDKQLFKKLLVKSRKQILTDGLPEELDWSDSGEELLASEWHNELDKDEPLVIDCRNNYESEIGTFNNSIQLQTNVFSESWEKIDDMLKDVPPEKKIMTFCTGGIRCVKVNAYLRQKLGYSNVYRLSNGIISYENWIDGNDSQEGGGVSSKFVGSNYLFDGRRQRQQGTEIEIVEDSFKITQNEKQ